MNGNQIAAATTAARIVATAPCQLCVAIKPLRPTGVGHGCWAVIFWNEVRCDCKVADHGTCHWCQNERNDQINIVDNRQTEEQRLVDVENARNDCHFAEFTHLARLGHESHVQNCTKRSTWTTDRDESGVEFTGIGMEITGNVCNHVCRSEWAHETPNDRCTVDTEEPKEMNQEGDDQNAPPCIGQSWYEWEWNVKQVEDVSVAYDQNGIDDQNDECDQETWNKRRERIRNALWNRVWHLDRPALFYAETVDLNCQGAHDETCENAGCTDARKTGATDRVAGENGIFRVCHKLCRAVFPNKLRNGDEQCEQWKKGTGQRWNIKVFFLLIDFRVVISKRSCKEEGGDSQRRIIDNGKETIETPKRAVVKINERRERDDLSENAQDEEHRSDDREGDDTVAGTHDGADKTCIGEFAD